MPLYKGGEDARHYTICRCRKFVYPSTWRDNDLWSHRYDRDGAPVPAACVDCGGWESWKDRVCSRCGNRYYFHFIHTGQRFFPNDTCWPCCQLSDVTDYKFWGAEGLRVPPNPVLFPRRRTLAEIREALNRI